jgi:hypothetical protein
MKSGQNSPTVSAFIHDRYDRLTNERDVLVGEFNTERRFVGRFEKTRPKLFVYFNPTSDDSFC